MESSNNVLVRRNIGSLNPDENKCFKEEALISTKNLEPTDYNIFWLSNVTTKDVVLPDTKYIPCGWSVKIGCKSTSTQGINVKSYHTTAPVLVKSLALGEFFEFTLLARTSSAGTWAVTSLSDGSSGDVTVTGDNIYTGDNDFTGNNEFTGSNEFTGNNDFTTSGLELPLVTPVNARATTLVATIAARPAGYVSNVFSTLTTNLVGDNNDMIFTSKVEGVAGDAIEIKYTDPGAEGDLAISVVGTVINITLANSGDPVITTTASQIKSLIEATPAAHALIGVTYVALNDGSGVVTALAQTPLAGGVDEVDNYITVAGKDYVFCTTAGDSPTIGHPGCVAVTTAGAATPTDVADALEAALELDTDNFSASSVSNVDAVLTVSYKTKGVIGNTFLTYTNNLGTPGNITTPGIVAGVNGSIGLANQFCSDENYYYLCTADNTIADANWKRLSIGASY